MNINSITGRTDPGKKKGTDGYSKQITPGKIVNEQDQEKIGNTQGTIDVDSAATQEETPGNEKDSDQTEELHTNQHLSEKITEEAEHVTDETIEEDRKQEAGINP